jgi:prophage endopeptidase
MNRESILATAVIGLVLSFLTAGLIFGFKYKSKADDAAKSKEQLNSQQLITSSVLRSMSVFNMIAKAAYESQENNNTKSKLRVEYIIQRVSTDKCASQLVPDNAASELLRHSDQIRQGSASTDTGKPD